MGAPRVNAHNSVVGSFVFQKTAIEVLSKEDVKAEPTGRITCERRKRTFDCTNLVMTDAGQQKRILFNQVRHRVLTGWQFDPMMENGYNL